MANVQMLGPVSAGKSSFINSVATVDRGRYTEMCITSESGLSMTCKHTKYTSRRGSFQNISMFDCMGIQCDDGGFNVNDVVYLVEGHISKDYKFNPAGPITADNPNFIRKPDENSKIHCVVYVVEAKSLCTAIPKPLKDKFSYLQERLMMTGIPRVVIITKIDKMSEEISHDVARTFRSSEVRDVVNVASELFKLPKLNVFPVKNYSDSRELCHKTNVLILLALKSILNLSEDYLLQQVEDEED